jgi:hypothetical protein
MMQKHLDKTRNEQSKKPDRTPSQEAAQGSSAFQFEDNRHESTVRNGLQMMADSGPQVRQLQSLGQMAEASPQAEKTAQMQTIAQFKGGDEEEKLAQLQVDSNATANRTGLPDSLRYGVENMSGVSLDGVKVHYNSSKPAHLQALAYTQGADIHVGPGQERHLPHEAWHVVQQRQGRVRPTTQVGGAQVNDDAGLEGEADVMGARAIAQRVFNPVRSGKAGPISLNGVQAPLQAAWDTTDVEGVEAWDTLISGVRWYRDASGRLWFHIESGEGEAYSFWEGEDHKYTEEQWDSIEADVMTPESEPGADVLDAIQHHKLEKSNSINIGSSRPKFVYLFTADGSPTMKKSEARYMVDTGMDRAETRLFLRLRSMLIRTPKIYGYHDDGFPIVEFLNNQATVTSQLAPINVGVARSLKLDTMTGKFDPRKWLNTLADINTLIKLKYDSRDFQFMIDKNTGHVYIMDLESGNTPSFSSPNPGLLEARLLIEDALKT